MELDVKPEDINRLVASAVAQSAIGQHVQAAVAKVLDDLAKKYQNPYEEYIKSIAHQAIRETVEKEFGPAIKEKAAERVRVLLTDAALDTIITKAVEAIQKAFESRY